MNLIKKIILEEYSAFVLDNTSRNKLEKLFPPKFPEFIGHHITHQFGVKKDSEAPESPKSVEVIGYSSEDGLEALIVSINGSHIRPDGKVYHITWSLDRSKGKKPVHSNELIKNGWEKVGPISIKVLPKILA